jgi:hypothetical protein
VLRLFVTVTLLSAALHPATAFTQQVPLIEAPIPVYSPASNPASPASNPASSCSFVPPSSVVPVPISPTETKPGFALQDWTLLGTTAALRFLDYKSTVRCVSDPLGCKEIQLPQALVHDKPALGAFEASTVVANYYAYRLFVRHDHRNLARVGQSIYLSAMAFTVGHNYYEIGKLWPHLAIEADPRP